MPIATSPGRAGFELNLELTYDSGAGNGPFGIGWRLSTPSITRKTDKGLPRYRDAEQSDTFVLSGAEDLVPVPTPSDAGDADHDVQRYRPRVEGLFARIERWTRTFDGDVHWRAITRDNVLNIYGRSPDARIADPRPDRKDPSMHPAVGRDARVFSWLLEETRDDRGNIARYRYKAEDGAGVEPRLSELSRFRIDDQGVLVRDGNGKPIFEATAQRYLERIQYGNRTPVARSETASNDPGAWLFEVVFDYGEYTSPDAPDVHATRAPRPESLNPSEPLAIEGAGEWSVRSDPFSTYRAGFEVRTYRLCRRVLMFHRFPEATHGLDISPCLVRSTDFRYDEGPVVSYLESVTQAGYLWKTADNELERATLPPLSLGYAKPPAEFDQTLRSVDRDSLEGIASGVDGSFHQWVDLDGEGLPGVLTAHQRAWYYKRNEGGGRLAPPQELRSLPSPAELGSGAQLTDLAGDGQLDLVKYSPPLPGYFTRTQQGDWQPFASFSALPNIDWNDPNLRLLDLDGDGHPDVLITEHNAFVWYRSRAKEGFEPAAFARKSRDEIQGPAVVFADGTETIFLADMSGDGLIDIARIRNGEVCYWPNLGYGCFGRRVTFENSPRFDAPDQFDPKRIRFADIDGSGTSDILYLARDGAAIYLNQSGNALSERKLIRSLPPVDSASSLNVIDLLGQGTSCLVWSSPLPAYRSRPLTYVDPLGLMPDGQHKPHVLTSIINNLGAETRIAYAPSIKFYLEDRKAGRPWLTRLAFPVQVAERIERVDHVNRSRLVTRFAYHHGYFDGHEREFRGFACVEQWDAESFGGDNGKGVFSDVPYDVDPDDPDLNLPPVRTVTWFHTGAWLERERLERELAREYYDKDPEAPLLVDTVLPTGLSVKEEREAARALRGKILRQEIYAEDNTPQAGHPYSVSERNYELHLIKHAENDGHAIFFVHPRETIDLHYERKPDDPRMQHELVLAVDDFGNVTRSAAIAYPRRSAQKESEEAATGHNLQEQAHLWATVSDASFISRGDAFGSYVVTSPHDPSGRAVPMGGGDERAWYRVGVPVETGTWELTGLRAPETLADAGGPAARWRALTADDVRSAIAAAGDLSFEERPDAGFQRRLIEAQRVRYFDDALQPLPIGKTGALALKHETYRLALTDGLVRDILDHDIAGHQVRVDNQWLQDEGRYLPGTGVVVGAEYDPIGILPSGLADTSWWGPSGHAVFDDLAQASSRFYLPEKAEDAFGQLHKVDYDAYALLVCQTEDPFGNTAIADNDYRVLAPRRLTDPNDSQTEMAFDALGMPSALWRRGNAGEGDPSDKPGVLFRYDLYAWLNGEGPAWSHTASRERHGEGTDPLADTATPDRTGWQHARLYADGSGREAMRKVQAERGLAPTRDGSGNLVVGPDGKLVEEATDNRWVGTGRTVFDNKGNPIKKYEPYFSSTIAYEDEPELVEAGVTPILRYDPLGRLIRTDQPNGTFSRVIFDAWSQESWDENDTVLQSGWYVERGSPDPAGPEPSVAPGTSDPDLLRRTAERRAAWLAAKHAGTPTVAHLDALGRPFLHVAHNRTERSGEAMTEAWPETRVELDIEGNQVSVTDDRKLVVLHQDFDVLGRVLHSSSPDAGDRWILLDAGNKPVRSWNSRRHTFWRIHDRLQRPTHAFVSGDNGVSWKLVQRSVYGEELAGAVAAKSKYLRGQLYQAYDGAGLVINAKYDFKGNLEQAERRVTTGYRDVPDWIALEPRSPQKIVSGDPLNLTVGDMAAAAGAQLENETFTVSTLYDALNRIISHTTPDGSETRPTYNAANLLEKIEVRLRGAPTWTTFVESIDYNARGQRLEVVYGNSTGTRTEYIYDKQTFRLANLTTIRGTTSRLQDLSYTYDPVGNITEIADAAQQALFFGGAVVEPKGRYRYDSLCQLVEAEGREHPGQQPTHEEYSPMRAVPNPNDVQALRNYTEKYFYDSVGNIERMRHSIDVNDRFEVVWQRHYAYHCDDAHNARSNRLLCTSVEGDPIPASHPHCATIQSRPYSAKYEHDPHGNMIAMPHLERMDWDHADRLQHVKKQNGAAAVNDVYFAYNSSGERARKVYEHSGLIEERIYLGGYEVYRRRSGTTLEVERHTLHVMDDQRRVALVETKTRDNGTDVSFPTPRQRYQLDNHLGSALVELADNGEVITYEEYFPFGGTAYRAAKSGGQYAWVEASAKRYRYNGKERDEETGLYYYGARYYAAWLGRWTAADPAGFVDGVNVFAYVRNAPTRLADPSGFGGEEVVTRAKGIAGDAYFSHFVGRHGGEIEAREGNQVLSTLGKKMVDIERQGLRPGPGLYGRGVYAFAGEHGAGPTARGGSLPYVSFQVDPKTPIEIVTISTGESSKTYVLFKTEGNLPVRNVTWHNATRAELAVADSNRANVAQGRGPTVQAHDPMRNVGGRASVGSVPRGARSYSQAGDTTLRSPGRTTSRAQSGVSAWTSPGERGLQTVSRTLQGIASVLGAVLLVAWAIGMAREHAEQGAVSVAPGVSVVTDPSKVPNGTRVLGQGAGGDVPGTIQNGAFVPDPSYYQL